jgi:hypothetical protein
MQSKGEEVKVSNRNFPKQNEGPAQTGRSGLNKTKDITIIDNSIEI